MSARATAGVAFLGLLAAAAAVAAVVTSDHATGKAATIALAVPTGVAYIVSGLVARRRRPENGTGVLMILVGFAWFFAALPSANVDLFFTVGLVLNGLFIGFLAHLLLAFPSGRLGSRADRVVTATMYALVTILPLTGLMLDEGEIASSACETVHCPDNLLATFDAQPVANVIAAVYGLGAGLLSLGVAYRLVLRRRLASPALRRALDPILVTAGVLIVAFAAQIGASIVSERASRAVNWFVLAAMLALPLAFLYGLLRPRLTASTRRLVAELSAKRDPEEVQDVLRRELRDPTLELGYRHDAHGWVDVHGRPLAVPEAGSGRAVTEVGDEVIVHDAALRDQPELAELVDATHIALERGLSLRSLEASERRATAILEAIPDNVYRVADDGTFLEARANKASVIYPAGYVYPGVPAETIIGKRVQDVMPEVAPFVMQGVRRALRGDTPTVEFTIETPIGPRDLELRVAPSGPADTVGIVRDVTERKQQERELRRLAEEQAALSRVAVAVATAEAPAQIFDVVAEEVGRLLAADTASLVRFDPDDPDAAVVVGRWEEPSMQFAEVGTNVALEGGPIARVRATGEATRGRASDPDLPDALRERLRTLGVSSLVAAPIDVSGERWGAVVVSLTGDEEFEDDAEGRISQFAHLVAVALANAEAREELAGLAGEQAALSRVAVAVATGLEPEQIFNLVTEEAARLFGARWGSTVRYEDDADEVVVVGNWHLAEDHELQLGARFSLRGGAITRVKETRRAARIEYVLEPDPLPRQMVAAPIIVGGRLWGATTISMPGPASFPPDAEERLGKFTNLVAVALANAQAHAALAGLAKEQAALSRVAIAAATERPDRLFDIVSEEVGKLFGARWALTSRFADDGTHIVVMGNWGEAHQLPVGTRRELTGGALTRVLQTGRPARTDVPTEPPEIGAEMRADNIWSSVAAPIVVSGKLWGATAITLPEPDVFPRGVEERLGEFTRLIAVALANAEAREELTASRARIVQAGDAERRRLERNLHDGAQQRLVSLALGLRLAQAKLPGDPEAAKALLEAASDELALGLEELRELARGIHPAILSDRGLAPALEALADRATLPVEVTGLPAERLPEPIEAAAFYVVAESLTNVAKYASASVARVDVARNDGLLVVEVTDDGVGGADAAKGSGLRGLSDRVEALGGRFQVASEPGRGTTVRAELPVG